MQKSYLAACTPNPSKMDPSRPDPIGPCRRRHHKVVRAVDDEKVRSGVVLSVFRIHLCVRETSGGELQGGGQRGTPLIVLLPAVGQAGSGFDFSDIDLAAERTNRHRYGPSLARLPAVVPCAFSRDYLLACPSPWLHVSSAICCSPAVNRLHTMGSGMPLAVGTVTIPSEDMGNPWTLSCDASALPLRNMATSWRPSRSV
ncbi:hypothetical protein ZWY2020_009650 [Hordeum vulgare]|nr:hypothetical protein ZWY2020_009650 [Hordeum vulgare]